MDVELIDLTYEDLEMMREWRNSPEVARYMNSEDQISAEQQNNWYNKIKDLKTYKYWIVTYDKKKIGVVNLADIDFKNHSCDWGFYLGNTEFRGKGIGSKVTYLIVKYALEDLNLNKISADLLAFNEPIIRIHEKFGFEKEGYFKEKIFKNDEYIDVVRYSMLKKKWLASKDNLYSSLFQ